MSASRGADGLSRGRYVRARPSVRIYTYTPLVTHTRVGRRARERDGRRTHTTPLTNPRQPFVGEFLLRHRTAVTEPRLRPPSQPRTSLPLAVPFTVVGAAPHRDAGSSSGERATHTRPNERTNERMYVRLPCSYCLLARSLSRSLARPRSTERTTVPTTAEPSRAEPSPTPKSRSRACARARAYTLRNLPQERKLVPTTAAT